MSTVGLYDFEGLQKLGVTFEGPNNKDHNILESTLGSPYLGKLQRSPFNP